MRRLYLCRGPHCSARGSAASAEALEQAIWEAGLLDAAELRSSGCQDHCDHGPNLLVQPDNCRYVGVTPERAVSIVQRHLVGGEPATEWLARPEMRRKPQG